MNTRKVEEYIKRLKKRERFLEDRIDEVGPKAHYDRAEYAAISWAIRYIEDTELEAADHLTKTYKENKNGSTGQRDELPQQISRSYIRGSSGHDSDDQRV